MTLHALPYTLHVLCALIWVGGMFFAWMILRPAAVNTLQAPQRLSLWCDVLPRFFAWVWLAVLVLPITGFGMLHLRQHTNGALLHSGHGRTVSGDALTVPARPIAAAARAA